MRVMSKEIAEGLVVALYVGALSFGCYLAYANDKKKNTDNTEKESE